MKNFYFSVEANKKINNDEEISVMCEDITEKIHISDENHNKICTISKEMNTVEIQECMRNNIKVSDIRVTFLYIQPFIIQCDTPDYINMKTLVVGKISNLSNIKNA